MGDAREGIGFDSARVRVRFETARDRLDAAFDWARGLLCSEAMMVAGDFWRFVAEGGEEAAEVVTGGGG